jgi:hypothetical protein
MPQHPIGLSISPRNTKWLKNGKLRKSIRKSGLAWVYDFVAKKWYSVPILRVAQTVRIPVYSRWNILCLVTESRCVSALCCRANDQIWRALRSLFSLIFKWNCITKILLQINSMTRWSWPARSPRKNSILVALFLSVLFLKSHSLAEVK